MSSQLLSLPTYIFKIMILIFEKFHILTLHILMIIYSLVLVGDHLLAPGYSVLK